MGIKDFFGKKKTEEKGETAPKSPDDSTAKVAKGKQPVDFSEAMANVDTSQLSMKEKLGLKMFQKMSSKRQEDVLRQAMNPKAISQHKDKILAQINEMVKNGQIDKGQAEAVKSKMGLR